MSPGTLEVEPIAMDWVKAAGSACPVAWCPLTSDNKLERA